MKIIMMHWFYSGRPLSPGDTKSEKSSATAMTGVSSTTAGTGFMGNKLTTVGSAGTKAPEAFVSIQLEKVHIC